MNTEEKESTCPIEIVKQLVDKELEKFSAIELNPESLDTLSELVDIKKDLENIDYWDVKKEGIKMRYNDYRDGNYSGNYGRRGVPGTGRANYRGRYSEGEEMIDNMRESYNAYSDSMEAYNRGNYNAGQDSMEALEDTMELFTEFAHKMIQEVDSPEAKQIIKKHFRKISQMSGM